MESQGERVLGVVDMDVGVLESMVQDGDPEQDIGVQEQFSPQTDPEPEMDAAAAAEYDTPHPSPIKILPQPPAKPRPTKAIRLRRGQLTSTGWGKC